MDIRGGARPFLNLMCQALCKPIGGLPLSESRWRGNGWEGHREEIGGTEGEEGGEAGFYVNK